MKFSVRNLFRPKAQVSRKHNGINHRAPHTVQSRFFHAAQSDRFTGDWGATPLDADQIVDRNHTILVARSREMAANNDFLRKYLRMMSKNVIGDGVLFQSHVRDDTQKLDDHANTAIEAAWKEWCRPKHCDILGKNGFVALSKAVLRSVVTDGECFINLVMDPNAKFGLSLQLIDATRCPVDYNVERLPNGNHIRHGIEYDNVGRAIAYFFRAPGGYIIHERTKLTKINATQIQHVFKPEFIGQRRGLPWASAGMWRLRNLEKFIEAALVNARISAAKMGFFTKAKSEDDFQDQGVGAAGEAHEQEDMAVEPGTLRALQEGWDFKSFDPRFPSADVAAFVKVILRQVASGVDISYNTFANDLEGVNFSSMRHGVIEERESAKEDQAWFIEQFCQPIFEAWLWQALVHGQLRGPMGKPLPIERFEKFNSAHWQGRRWQWIDPKSEVFADRQAVQMATKSLSQIIRDRGQDPQVVFDEINRDIEALKKSGVPDEVVWMALFGDPNAINSADEPKSPDTGENDD